MGNSPSITGPDRGRLHVIGDDDEDANTVRGQRPEQLRIQETVAQLADGDSEEEIRMEWVSLNRALVTYPQSIKPIVLRDDNFAD